VAKLPFEDINFAEKEALESAVGPSLLFVLKAPFSFRFFEN
jgi:hypothetical protein